MLERAKKILINNGWTKDGEAKAIREAGGTHLSSYTTGHAGQAETQLKAEFSETSTGQIKKVVNKAIRQLRR